MRTGKIRSSKTAVDVLAVAKVERAVVREAESDLTETFHDGPERAHLPGCEVDGATLDLGELLVHGHPVGAQRGNTGSTLLDQAADSDLKELVEVAARDGEELRPLEQRARAVLGELEHAGVEVEPAEVPVDVPMPAAEVGGMVGSPIPDSTRCLVARPLTLGERHQPSSSIAPESRKTRSSAMLVTRSAMRSRWWAMNTRLVARKTVVLSSVIIWIRSSNSRW